MDVRELKHVIRETVRIQIREAKKKASAMPKKFPDFRKKIASALKSAGAPKPLVDEVADVGYEGGGVVNALWSVWSDIEAELRDGDEDLTLVDFALDIHDAVLDMLSEYGNSMNYEPGRKTKKMSPSEMKALAVAVRDIIGAASQKSAKASGSAAKGAEPPTDKSDAADKITKILKKEGAKVQLFDQKSLVALSVDVGKGVNKEDVLGYLDEQLQSLGFAPRGSRPIPPNGVEITYVSSSGIKAVIINEEDDPRVLEIEFS